VIDKVEPRPISRSQRLHEILGSLIASTPPGERLPSEPQLSRQLGVSRATLREAMRTFETQGLIRRRQGSGTFVVHPAGVIETGLEVLESIETMAERIGLHVSMGSLKVEHRQATAVEAEILEIPGESNVVHLSRVILAEKRPVAYLIDALPDAVVRPEDFEPDFTGSVLDLILARGTPSLMTSRCEITAAPATPEVARALGIQRGDVLLRFEAYLYTSEGRVVDHSFSYFLPGYFRFHVIRRVG
jgi:GntR family transcriptional regulator